jgi:hypothetical protein
MEHGPFSSMIYDLYWSMMIIDDLMI